MRSFFAQQDHLGGPELRYRLFELHAHLTSLPWLAQVISLVGWPKLVKFFFSYLTLEKHLYTS